MHADRRPLIAWFLLFPLLFATTAVASETHARIEKRTYDFKEAGKPEMEYALFVPSSYDAGGKTAPLIVLLHGLGSNPQQVIRYQGITEEAEKRGYIVVAPFGYNERGWYGARGKGRAGLRFVDDSGDPENLGELSAKDVLHVLALVRKEFRIDKNRIYLMGHSMGGGGTVHLGIEHADTWAALAPLSPAMFGAPDVLAKIRRMPIIVVQGENDRLVPTAGVRVWVDKMKALEMDYK